MKKIIVLVSITLLIVCLYLSHEKIVTAKQIVIKKEVIEDVVDATKYVEIKGEVLKPGVYEVNKNDRVKDLIHYAEGLLDSADITHLNLARRLIDEEVIIIYKESEALDEIQINNAALEKLNLSETKYSSNQEEYDFVINVNQANVEELMKLPGIGKTKAQAIIDYRKKSGGFKELNQLMEVKGIGDKTFEKIKSFLKL